MRILILSCNTGQGHNTAAHSIKEALDKRGDSYEMKNALRFLSQTADDIICDGHVFLYRRLPKLFGVGYRFEERHSPKFICNQLRRGIGKLQKYLSENHFDAIICTHIFAAILVNELKKKTGLKIFTGLITTDFTCYPGSVEASADAYFIAHPLLTGDYLQLGISKEKIIPCGIPVSQQFLTKENSISARQSLGLPLDRHIVLVSGGSMGAGPIVKMSKLLSNRLSDSLIVVACGTNTRLIQKISSLNMPNILALPFTKKMALYLDAADVYLSKAGGLSTAEAVMKEIPLVYINAVPGCETRNIEFMTKNSYAAAAFTPEDAVMRTVYALNHKDSAKAGISKCRSELALNPADYICEHISVSIK